MRFSRSFTSSKESPVDWAITNESTPAFLKLLAVPKSARRAPLASALHRVFHRSPPIPIDLQVLVVDGTLLRGEGTQVSHVLQVAEVGLFLFQWGQMPYTGSRSYFHSGPLST